MALEPITRQEKIIAGQDLTPITRMEKFLKQFGGGGGGSVPKPLTYDYMPEGYPRKSVGTVTLMEEQELAFAHVQNGVYVSQGQISLPIVRGQSYTVNWDGAKYECVCVEHNKITTLGNLSIMGKGEDTGEPFLYENGRFGTFDTSTIHTISVTTAEEVVTPMAEEFLPTGIKELIMSSSTTDSTKKFKITVDDSGTISATEVT